MKKILLSTIITLLTVCPFPENVLAGPIPVIDGANVAQSILEAARALKSNVNEATMIVNQVKSLENELRNLTKLDFNIIDEYSENLTRLFEEMGSIHGLMQDLSSLQLRFEELYPDFNNETAPLELQRASDVMDQALDESRQMMLGAARTGAVVLENLPKTEAQLEELLADSSASVGILQAAQAGNQISALVASQLMNLNAQLANFNQAQVSYMQKQNTAEAISRKRGKRVLEGKRISTEPPVPF